MKFLLLIAAAVLTGTGAGVWYWQGRSARELNAELQKRFPPRPAYSQKLRALEYTQQHLRQVPTAHFALFVAREHIIKRFAEAPPIAIEGKDAPQFKSLQTDRVTVRFEPASMAIGTHFTAELSTVPVTLEGTLTVGAAPALEGSSIILFPTVASVTFNSVSFRGEDSVAHTADVVAQALNNLLDYGRRVISGYEIPVNLGLAERLDLRAEIAKLPGVAQTEGSVIDMGVSVQDAAVLVTGTHLAIVGSLIRISPDLKRNTIAELAAIAEVLQGNRTGQQGCPDCGLSLDPLKLARCVPEKLQCEINKAAGARLSPPKTLTPVQAVVLRDFKHTPTADAQRLYRALEGYLTPRLFLDGTEPPQDDERAFDARYGAILAEMMKAAEPMMDKADLQEAQSSLGFSRDFVGSALGEIVAGASASADYRLTERSQSFHQTIKTDPATNLNCGNQRGCDSDFAYPPHQPAGCDSNCTIRKCAFGICVDTVDLACAARKLDCERRKEQQRISYEVLKAAEHARFIGRKLDCERLKAMERAGCEINQTWLNQTQNVELADIVGTATVRDLVASGTVGSLSMAKDISSVSLQAHISGKANVNAAFTFIPKNAGHLACFAKWSGALDAGLSIPAQNVSVQANLDEAASQATNSSLIYKVPSRNITLKMSPAPGLALLSQNPQFLLVCPVPVALFSSISAALPSPVGHLARINLLLEDSIPITVPEQPLRIQFFDVDELKASGFQPALRLTPKAVIVKLSSST